MAGLKRKIEAAEYDLDIPTFSDSDDIPDLDGPSDEETAAEVPNKRRKKKAQYKKQSEEEDEEQAPDEGFGWASQGRKDNAFDPDFQFDDNEDGGTLAAFDEWELPSGDKANSKRQQGGADLDEIIRRRRAAQKATEPEATNLTSDQEDLASDLEMEEGQDDDDHDDELLADDAFGVNVPEENSDDDDSDADGDDEEEEDAVTAPMPDVDMDDDEGNSDEENEDPNEIAKRDAFFAPEDKSNDPKALSKTEISFQSMSLSRPILRGLTAVGFTAPTPIQSKSVPVALLGKDIVGGAVTGSGKTAAFLLPILERLLYRPKKVPTTRVGILLPTRELAVQCHNVAKKLAQFTDISFALIVGGLSLRDQEQTLKKRPDVVIATPGRFIDHMRNTASFAVESLEILVLDEADRMLEEGFADELDEVLKTIPRSRQTMLFSATMTQDVDKLIRVGMNRPVRLMVDSKQQTVSGLVQEFVKLRNAASDGDGDLDSRRLATLIHLCKAVYTTQTIIFIPTKTLAHRIKILFALRGVKAAELHGSMSQEQRLSAITSFRDGKCTHLLATDLASRGLDIPRVDTVINYTVPSTKETYLHRVGRTARAGRSGVACTIFSATKPASTTGKGSSSKASERTFLRPILRLAKNQKAPMRTRILPPQALEELSRAIAGLDNEVDEIMKEEREERLLAQTERDVMKSENIMEHEDEILSRPRRTWFQSEHEKRAAKAAGKDVRMGLGPDATDSADKKDKKKLSNKNKKSLDAKDMRKSGAGWKKRKDERMGKGVIATAKENKSKSKQKKKQQKKGGKA